ncbi:MAG: hypothetical protein ACE5JX_16050 [Acidobacteriota bacterium]
MVGGAFDVILGRRLEELEPLEYLPTKREAGACALEAGLLRNAVRGEELPILLLRPPDHRDGKFLIWIDRRGKQGLLKPDGEPRDGVARALEAGLTVVGVDLFEQGEFLRPGRTLFESARLVVRGNGSQPWERAPAFTFGYNYPLFSQRTHDILSVIRALSDPPFSAVSISLAGLGPTTGPLVAAALAQSSGAVARAAIDTRGFRFSELSRVDHPMFLPGAAKYGDLPGLLSLSSARELWLAGEGREAPPAVEAVVRWSHDTISLTLSSDDSLEKAVAWLVRTR